MSEDKIKLQEKELESVNGGCGGKNKNEENEIITCDNPKCKRSFNKKDALYSTNGYDVYHQCIYCGKWIKYKY